MRGDGMPLMRRLTMPLALLLLFTACGDDSVGSIEAIEPTATSALATETTATTMLLPDTVVAETTVAPTTTEPIVEPSGPIRVTESGDIGVGPFDAFASPEGYWVVDEGGEALHRVDATTGHVLHYPLGNSVSDINWRPSGYQAAAGLGAVWILYRGQLTRMDVSGRIDTIALPGYGMGLGIGPTAVWVATVIGEVETEDCHENCEPGRLAISRIINDGLRLTATLEMPIGYFYHMAFLRDSVWLLGEAAGAQPLLVRVNETGSEIESWPIETEFVTAMEAAHGFVWLENDQSGLLRVDPSSGDQVPLAAGVKVNRLATGPTNLWVLLQFDRSANTSGILEVDPGSGNLTPIIPIEDRPHEILAVGDYAVVRTYDFNLLINWGSGTVDAETLAGFEDFVAIGDTLWMIDPADGTVLSYSPE